MDKSNQLKIIGKVRTSIIFSVLSIIMNNLNSIYRPIDIIMVALTVNFVCAVLHSVIFAGVRTKRRLHCGYILRSISRQSVLVVSSAIASSIHLRDIGTQSENTMILVVSTTAFIGLITCIPNWFLQDAQQGSLKNILIYSFTARYRQIHIPGLSGNTGIGTLLYGCLFVIITLSDDPNDTVNQTSNFLRTLKQTASMILSNLFLLQIAPRSTSQVLPIALLLGMYIVSDRIPMSGSVASFVLWRTSAEVSLWTLRIFTGGFTDQLILYSLLLCIIPAINEKTSAVIAVAMIQTVVACVMKYFIYLGSVGTLLSSMCILLVTDMILDTRQQ
jgi:hypothetical protein